MEKNCQIKALVVGVGLQGERYAKAQLLEKNSATVLFDIDQTKTKETALKIEAQHSTSLEKSLDWANLVYICTPDHLHTDTAVLAIQKGKTVLCEKPLTTNLDDALLLQQLGEKYKTKLLVGNLLRLAPNFADIRHRVISEEIGPLISIRSTYLHDMSPYMKPGNWRLNQNFLYGAGTHPIDLACWIANEPVVEVQASTGIKDLENYTQPDDYQIILKFQSGFLGHIWLNAAVQLPIHKTDIEVFGKKGTIISDNRSGTVKTFHQGESDFLAKTFPQEMTIPKAVKIMNALVENKNNSHFPLPDINEALSLMKVLDAVEKSIKSKATVEIK